MLPLLAALAASGGGAAVKVSGESITAIDGVAPYNTTVAIRFNSDGTVDVREDLDGVTTWSQIDAASDWIIPNEAGVSEAYDVGFTNLNTGGGGDFDTEAAAEDAFTVISGNPIWSYTSTIEQAPSSFTCDFRIRNASAVVLSTGSFTFSIENSA